MLGSQITLTEVNVDRLRVLSQNTGRSEEDLIREALDLLAIRLERQSRLASLRRAKGVWRGREDLPDLSELRDEWDRD